MSYKLKNISTSKIFRLCVDTTLHEHDRDARGQISVRNRWVDTPGRADSSFVTKLISEIEKLQHKL